MSDSEQEERPRIKVTDRRMFDREGNVREDAESEREAPPKVADDEVPKVGRADDAATPRNDSGGVSTSSSASHGGPAEVKERVQGQTPGPGATGAPGAEASRGQKVDEERLRAAMDADAESQGSIATGEQSASELPRDFASFVESQYYETLLFLGAMPHPATGQTVEDLDMARYKIDLLSMIQDKTEGNRTPEESQLLEDVLYQLRMGYLQKRKVPKL